MLTGRMGTTLMIFTCAAALAVTTADAFAAVQHVTSAAIRPADAPSGFTGAHQKVYGDFVASMQVGISMRNLPSTASCALPSSFQTDGWRQGMIEAFDRSRPTYALQLCASLFGSTHGAHLAYRTLIGGNMAGLEKLKMASRLSMHRLGDESAAMTRSQKECVCDPKPTLFTYEVVFRRANAVVDLYYTGPASTPTQFKALATHIEHNLH